MAAASAPRPPRRQRSTQKAKNDHRETVRWASVQATSGWMGRRRSQQRGIDVPPETPEQVCVTLGLTFQKSRGKGEVVSEYFDDVFCRLVQWAGYGKWEETLENLALLLSIKDVVAHQWTRRGDGPRGIAERYEGWPHATERQWVIDRDQECWHRKSIGRLRNISTWKRMTIQQARDQYIKTRDEVHKKLIEVTTLAEVCIDLVKQYCPDAGGLETNPFFLQEEFERDKKLQSAITRREWKPEWGELYLKCEADWWKPRK